MKPPADWTLYLVADPHACRGRPVEDVVRLAVAGGATVVQLRDKECTTRRYVEQARPAARAAGARSACPSSSTTASTSPSPSAREGAHVGQSDMPPDRRPPPDGPGRAGRPVG